MFSLDRFPGETEETPHVCPSLRFAFLADNFPQARYGKNVIKEEKRREEKRGEEEEREDREKAKESKE